MSTFARGLESRPQHDERNQRHAGDRIQERDVDPERNVEHPEPRQQQADRGADDRGERKSDRQHHEARPQIGPQFAAADHIDGGDGYCSRRREQHRIDMGAADLPERKHAHERCDADRDIEQRLAPPALGRDFGARGLASASGSASAAFGLVWIVMLTRQPSLPAWRCAARARCGSATRRSAGRRGPLRRRAAGRTACRALP